MKRFEITKSCICVDDVVGRLTEHSIGAVSTFVGVVRGETEGRETLYLEYQAYPEMAEQELGRIGAEIRDRWPTIEEVAIVHRIGRIEIGETIVVIAVASPHRREVFSATHYAIDRLKQIVPIWKKEVWADGAEWRSERKGCEETTP